VSGAERQKRPKSAAERQADWRRRFKHRLSLWKLELPDETPEALHLSGNLDEEDLGEPEKWRRALQSVIRTWVSEVIRHKKSNGVTSNSSGDV
jgi:hypothetical protein